MGEGCCVQVSQGSGTNLPCTPSQVSISTLPSLFRSLPMRKEMEAGSSSPASRRESRDLHTAQTHCRQATRCINCEWVWRIRTCLLRTGGYRCRGAGRQRQVAVEVRAQTNAWQVPIAELSTPLQKMMQACWGAGKSRA